MLGIYLPYGLVVRIPGFHPGALGLIPGVGTPFTFWLFSVLKIKCDRCQMCQNILRSLKNFDVRNISPIWSSG